jgi:cytoskeleton protein RodZ
MTIEGLGKKFQDARIARGLTLDEAARMTKIRPSRLAEIEGDDFSQFPSLAYAKGFLLIYGKFLDVDVSPYMEAFEGSDAGVTVDGYSYLQSEPVAETQPRAPIIRRRPERVRPRAPRAPRAEGERTSIMPLVFGVVLLILGFFAMRFILNLTRLTSRPAQPTTTATTPAQTPAQVVAQTPAPIAAAQSVPPVAARTPAQVPVRTAAPIAAAPTATPAQVTVATTNAVTPPPAASTSTAVPTATSVAVAPPPKASPAAAEPEVRRAEPVRPEDLKAAAVATTTTQTAPGGPNRLTIRPTKKTYVKVVVDDETRTPVFERWVSPSDGPIEFRGEKFAVRVLDREAVQIKKNGENIENADADVTVQ